MAADTQLTQRLAWKVLQGHYETVSALHMRNLFTEDPQRAERFSMEVLGIYLDYSKNWITGETIPLLVDLASRQDCQRVSKPCFVVTKLISRKTGRYYMWLFVHPNMLLLWWIEKMSFPKCMPFWIKRHLPIP